MKMQDEELVIKINTHGNPMPVSFGEWTDLAIPEEVSLKQFETAVISFGINMKAPDGWHPLVASRSSTALKHGVIIANGIGIIEHNYCGDEDYIGMVVFAVRDTVIPAGTRLGQFTIVPRAPKYRLEQVETMGEPNRGGYGSTGV